MNINNTMMGAYVYNEETHNFSFLTDLSAHSKAVFVRTVVDAIVKDTVYDSVLRDIIFDYVIISMLTDVDTSFLKTVDNDGDVVTDIDFLEQFLIETNIAEIVKANAFPTLFDELNKAVDDNIAYRTGIHSNPLNNALASLLSTLERKISEVDLGSMMEMAQKFAGMTGELTTENIVNAYMNSDIHKKNLDEIKKAKTENQIEAKVETVKKPKKTNKKVAKVETEEVVKETEKIENVD